MVLVTHVTAVLHSHVTRARVRARRGYTEVASHASRIRPTQIQQEIISVIR